MESTRELSACLFQGLKPLILLSVLPVSRQDLDHRNPTNLILVPLSTFPENFIKIHPILSELFLMLIAYPPWRRKPVAQLNQLQLTT